MPSFLKWLLSRNSACVHAHICTLHTYTLYIWLTIDNQLSWCNYSSWYFISYIHVTCPLHACIMHVTYITCIGRHYCNMHVIYINTHVITCMLHVVLTCTSILHAHTIQNYMHVACMSRKRACHMNLPCMSHGMFY